MKTKFDLTQFEDNSDWTTCTVSVMKGSLISLECLLEILSIRACSLYSTVDGSREGPFWLVGEKKNNRQNENSGLISVWGLQKNLCLFVVLVSWMQSKQFIQAALHYLTAVHGQWAYLVWDRQGNTCYTSREKAQHQLSDIVTFNDIVF